MLCCAVLFLGRAKQSWLVALRVLHMAKHSKAWNSAVIVWHIGKKMHGTIAKQGA